MDSTVHTTLGRYVAGQQLPASYLELIERWLVPLSAWLGQHREQVPRPLLVGVHGAQGSGKTTLCGVLDILLAAQGWRSLTLSLDDFYYPRAHRQELAKRVHPLLQTRGVPGTHDVEWLRKVLAGARAGQPLRSPRFAKALDDRMPEGQWAEVPANIDIVLLEGWCVGCQPQSAAALSTPVNALEASEDEDGRWRNYVNNCLATDYADLFAQLDLLLMLRVPSMAQVYIWRGLQEARLRTDTAGKSVMSTSELRRFIQHYERITVSALAQLGERADYVLELAADHSIVTGGPC